MRHRTLTNHGQATNLLVTLGFIGTFAPKSQNTNGRWDHDPSATEVLGRLGQSQKQMAQNKQAMTHLPIRDCLHAASVEHEPNYTALIADAPGMDTACCSVARSTI